MRERERENRSRNAENVKDLEKERKKEGRER